MNYVSDFMRNKNTDRAMALQRYLVLHSQQSRLRDTMSLPQLQNRSYTSSPHDLSPTNSTSPPSTSPSFSPTSVSHGGSIQGIALPPPTYPPAAVARARASGPRQSVSAPTLSTSGASPHDSGYIASSPEVRPARRASDGAASSSSGDEDDTQKLFEISKEIKATLTELLNMDSTKADAGLRAWVQRKLYDAEMAIKGHRRRRVSSVGDRDVCESIHWSLEM